MKKAVDTVSQIKRESETPHIRTTEKEIWDDLREVIKKNNHLSEISQKFREQLREIL